MLTGLQVKKRRIETDQRLKALISAYQRAPIDQRLKALIYRTQSFDCSCPFAIFSISVLMILQESICVDFLL